jgi:hypothetical protein
MICVLFSGFLGRVPYCATRISTSVTFRVSRGSPIKELQRYKQKQPNAIAYPALNDGACAHSGVKVAGFGLPLMLLAAGAFSSPAAAQVPPVIVPIVVDTAVPIIIGVVKPKPKPTGLDKFEGFVMHANNAQITVRAKGNDMAIRTFPLSEAASAKMQKIVDKGGYQYGDKVTVFYEPATSKAIKFKGKPSKPI